jgi:AcrR family transcriptional regulator
MNVPETSANFSKNLLRLPNLSENLLRSPGGMNIHSLTPMAPTTTPRARTSPPAADAAGPAPRASQPAIPTGGPRRTGGGDKREAILEAALHLFVERGFFGTAVPEIADRAGVGAGTIYRYFESKEALVNAIYRQEKLHFAHLVLDDFPVSAPTREQFRLLWTRMARFATEHTPAFIFLELHHHARYLDAESRAVEHRMTELFTSVVTGAQARHELKAGAPRLLMGLVMGAFVGVIRSCIDVEEPPSTADWKLAEQCVWEAIRS